jgi:tight adherence protein B
VTGLAFAALAAYGVHLIFTSVAFGWRGFGPGPRPERSTRRRRVHIRRWLDDAGLHDVSAPELAGAIAVLAVLGTAAGFTAFGGVVAPVAGAASAATLPLVAARARRDGRRARAQESWPRLIEEVRVLTSSLGRSVPQALFEAGRRAPESVQPAFADAHREWLLTTDFERSLAVLKSRLADPTADAACETLLVAHEVGGGDLDHRLEALAEDRLLDVHGRKDARARLAGARFARRFVLIVPVGMALTGLMIGDGRAAYETAAGQVAVATGVAMIAACWWWAGAIMRLPNEDRVFDQ